MTRELRRLLINPGRLRAAGDQRLAITPAEAHYLRRVLRLGHGDAVTVIDGEGRLWTAELTADGPLLLQQPLAEPLQRCSAACPPIALAMAVPRRDGELVWRMATELGVDRLQPLIAERTQARERGLEAWPLERWSTIVQEASEQCERLWLPQLQAPRKAKEQLAERPGGLGLIATTRQPGLPLLEELLAAVPDASMLPGVCLAIGPEGGWSEPELKAAQGAGWRAVSLGDTILRTATAAIAGVARLASWRSSISCASFPSPSP